MTAPRVDFCTWDGQHHLVALGEPRPFCGGVVPPMTRADWNTPNIAVQDICRECLTAFSATVPAK